jgi:hypothetical protein
MKQITNGLGSLIGSRSAYTIMVLCTTMIVLAAQTPVWAASFALLHAFDGADGAYPAGLIEATDGSFYRSSSGGANSGGTVVNITSTGTLTRCTAFAPKPTARTAKDPMR